MQLFLATANGNAHAMRYYLLVVKKKISMVVFQYLRGEMAPCANRVVFVLFYINFNSMVLTCS